MIFDQRKRSCPKNKLLFNAPFFAANLSTPCQLESSPCVQVGESIPSLKVYHHCYGQNKILQFQDFWPTNNKNNPCFGPRFIRTRSIWRSSILASPSARNRKGWPPKGVWKLVTVKNYRKLYGKTHKWSNCIAMQLSNYRKPQIGNGNWWNIILLYITVIIFRGNQWWKVACKVLLNIRSG